MVYFLIKYYFLLHILRFLFFFSINIMADVASKQQTTALFLSTIVTHTRRHTELTKKLINLMGNLCCAREHLVQFFVQFFFFYLVKLYILTYRVCAPLMNLSLNNFPAQKSALTLRRLMSYIYGAPILDVSRSHTTTQHSR